MKPSRAGPRCGERRPRNGSHYRGLSIFYLRSIDPWGPPRASERERNERLSQLQHTDHLGDLGDNESADASRLRAGSVRHYPARAAHILGNKATRIPGTQAGARQTRRPLAPLALRELPSHGAPSAIMNAWWARTEAFKPSIRARQSAIVSAAARRGVSSAGAATSGERPGTVLGGGRRATGGIGRVSRDPVLTVTGSP